MDNYLDFLKTKVKANKKTENLVVLIVLSVILLLVINYIFNENKKDTTKEVLSDNVQSTESENNTLEKNLEETLNAIVGVDNTKVVISYSSTETINPVYDTKENIDLEDSGSRKTTTEKTVAYEEANGDKVAIVASKNLAKPEGAVVVFDGNGDLENITIVKEAVSAVTGIAIHKIQVFQNSK